MFIQLISFLSLKNSCLHIIVFPLFYNYVICLFCSSFYDTILTYSYTGIHRSTLFSRVLIPVLNMINMKHLIRCTKASHRTAIYPPPSKQNLGIIHLFYSMNKTPHVYQTHDSIRTIHLIVVTSCVDMNVLNINKIKINTRIFTSYFYFYIKSWKKLGETM